MKTGPVTTLTCVEPSTSKIESWDNATPCPHFAKWVGQRKHGENDTQDRKPEEPKQP